MEPLTPLARPERRELDDRVEHIGEILNAEPQLTIGTVTTGAHA